MAAKTLTQFVVVIVVIVFAVCSVSAKPAAAKRWKTMGTIKEVNRGGPYVGLITVYSPEEEAFFKIGAFHPNPKHPYVDLSGRRYRVGNIHGKKVIYVRCGIGMVNAAAATQQLLDHFGITGIIHFGISGTANSSLAVGDVLIPKEIAQTGLWDWLKPNATTNDVAQFDFGNYNVPKGEGINLLGRVGFSNEQFYSESGEPDIAQSLLWMQPNQQWLKLAANLEGLELEQCLNSTECLKDKPKVVVGLKGATSNFFIDNAAYRDFLFKTFEVSSLDMESAAVVMTSMSNDYPVIVIRGLSDLAGAQTGENTIGLFGPLAALNVAKAVIQFVKTLPGVASF